MFQHCKGTIEGFMKGNCIVSKWDLSIFLFSFTVVNMNLLLVQNKHWMDIPFKASFLKARTKRSNLVQLTKLKPVINTSGDLKSEEIN